MSDHSLLLRMKLSDEEFGTDEEIEALHELGDELEEAIDAQDVGEYDGNEIGGGEYVHFIYGPDADAMLACVKPIIARSSYAGQTKATLRYGEPDDDTAREVQVTI